MVPAVARARDDGDTPSPEPPDEDVDRTGGDGEELASRFFPVDPSSSRSPW